MNGKRRLEDKLGPEKSVIAPDTRITGKIEESEGIVIRGEINGDVESKGLVWVGKGAEVQGDIRSPYIILDGKLTGNIHSAEHVELRMNSRMIGNIETEKLAVADGGLFEGEIEMPKRKEGAIDFVEKRKK